MLKGYYSLVLFALLANILLTFPQNSVAQTDTNQLVAAFKLNSSSQSDYAKNLEEATFYYQLNIQNLRQDLDGQKCVDKSFMSWIRKFFKADAKSISLTASVTMPDTTKQQIPIFQISMDEQSSPPQCLTKILTSEPLTPFFVGRRGGIFTLDVTAKTQQNVTFSAANATVSAASDLLSLTGGSAWLMKNVATSQAAVASAVNKIDTSLSNNWSSTAQTDYEFAVSPWPSDGDWSHQKDLAEFAVGSLVATAGGISVNPQLLPTLNIGLQYRTSLFGGGPGHYLPEAQILSSHLASNAGDTLENILKIGVGGFTTAQALAISDAKAMSQFCHSMQQTFSNFLTTDDELAARHAVLVEDTAFYQSSILHGADGCESSSDISRLKQLSSGFTYPDTLNRPQPRDINRSNFVKQRGSLLTNALLAGNSDKISSIVADPTKFILAVSSDAEDVFPNLVPNQSLNGVGATAISTLAGAGSFRSGCWSALPTQNLRNMVGAVLNKKTGNSSAIIVAFDSDFPGPGADPSTDRPKVTKLTFLSPDVVQEIGNVPNWPDPSCPLL
jgi:hypothetical protein